MIKPEELYEIANRAKERDGNAFVIEMLPALEREMRLRAESGEFELMIKKDSPLNEKGWLSKSYLYEPLKKQLEKERFDVLQSDDIKDGTYFRIRWNVEKPNYTFDETEEESQMGEDTPYKSIKQLDFLESLCKRPLVFHHAAEESYPEIEIHIHREFKPSMISKLLEIVLKKEGYIEEMVEVQPNDEGQRGYNELLLLLDLRKFDYAQISKLIDIVLKVVEPYASLTDVEY